MSTRSEPMAAMMGATDQRCQSAPVQAVASPSSDLVNDQRHEPPHGRTRRER
jgi:hypothetical protein